MSVFPPALNLKIDFHGFKGLGLFKKENNGKIGIGKLLKIIGIRFVSLAAQGPWGRAEKKRGRNASDWNM